ncbi:MAG: HAD family phosphatase [Verrucomicrobiae bacterium]|nr:HAD family phosphatase [Verrucomicrobiae bacterium]
MHTWGAIFDWDGVIIDSMNAHKESWEQLARETGKVLPPGYFETSFGMKSRKIITEILHWTNDPEELKHLDWRKEKLYRGVIRASGIEPLPGVVNWLKTLRTAAIPCVIASSTHSRNIQCAMEIIKLDEYFQGMITGENVSHGKPDPDVFLLAAKKIMMPTDRCVVFEDAHVGIEAARRAKMKVVGVATTHPTDTLQDADRVVKRLDELSVKEISEWF